MRLFFKPMPWLTVFAVLGLALLLKLGFWQKDRLTWKLDVLARVDAAANASAFTSLSDVVAALEAEEPVDYRRYAFEMKAVWQKNGYTVYDPSYGNMSWRMYYQIENSGYQVYLADTSRIDDETHKGMDFSHEMAWGTSSGYVRLAPKPLSGFARLIKSQPNEVANRWFHFNQNDRWDDDNTRMDIWFDEHKREIDYELPALRPDIRNNHRDYMLTWFAMAGLLLIFYALIHVRAGRLGRRK